MPFTKRYLVTGGAGFLGSHVCERLIARGADVLCVDNFFTGTRSNLAGLRDCANFELLRHDVTLPLMVEADVVINLACPASPIHYQLDPVQTIKTCVHGTLNMLGLAKRLKIPMFQASTSEVYGDPEVHPQPEGYWGRVNPIGPRSCYDEGKRCAEALMFAYHRQNGVAVKVGRLFNVYGPRMLPDDGRVISNFIVQALRNEPITIYGDGGQTRSFCYVEDMVDLLVRFTDDQSGFSGPLNMGNPQEITIRDLAETIRDLTGSRSPLRREPLPQDDPRQRRPDISLARERFGWEPTTPMHQGLQDTISYFEALLRRGKTGS